MGYYEQSDSERSKGNRNNETRKGVFSNVLKGIIRESSDKKAQEREAERYERQGNGKYINNGSDDRVNGVEYQGNIYTREDDRKSYHYGYTVHGGRRLYAVIDALQKANKIEEIIAIGKRDFENGVEEENLGLLKQNAYYMEGYYSTQKNKKQR